MVIEGVDFEGVTAMFDDLSNRMKKRAIRAGLKAAIDIVEAEILPNTPVNDGILKENAVTHVRTNGNKIMGMATFGYGGQSREALLVEYGHKVVGHEPDKKELGSEEPKPWIMPGWDKAMPAALEAFEDAISVEVVNAQKVDH